MFSRLNILQVGLIGRVKARLGLLAQAAWNDLDRSCDGSTDDL
jgi:hypothetical protein